MENNEATILLPKSTSPVEMYANGIYLDKFQYNELKSVIISYITEFKGFKLNTKMHLNEIKEEFKVDKCLKAA